MKNAILAIIVVGFIWYITSPPSYQEVGEHRVIQDVPKAISAADIGDLIGRDLETIAPKIPGHDEVLLIPGTNDVLVSARDEWIWRVNHETGSAVKLAYSPVSPTGSKMMPGNNRFAYFCMARLDYNQYEAGPGLYLLDIEKGEFQPLLTRVPITGQLREDGLELPNYDQADNAKVYTQPLGEIRKQLLDESNSRPMQFCNDLDVSRDGKHLYMTEPFSHPKASSGLGAMPEAITLARNGRVWRYNTETESVGLVVENSIFADGILIEYGESGREKSLLITETVNFLVSRAHLRGENAESYEVLWDNLPGLPDGMDRDEQGRVWVGIIKDRTPLMTWMHRNPWIKPLLLRVPSEWIPNLGGTGFMVLSEDASEVLVYSHHSGNKVKDLSVVVPIQGKLFLSSFSKNNSGVHFVSMDSVFVQK